MNDKKKPVAGRNWIIASALLALFLGALDALVMSAAMPTIIGELGGLHLYSWAYSSYFLARAVSLPVFGKLSDLFPTKNLFLFSITLFVLASVAAGASLSMDFLVATRIFQGIGTGGIFALVYVVLSDVALPGQRAKTLSLASSIWGIASLVGPTMGGFIVTWFSWRWIFYINLPLGIASLIGIALFFHEVRPKPHKIDLDIAGVILLSGFILGILTIVVAGGRDIPWNSPIIFLLGIVTILMGIGFYYTEKRANDPILNIEFFKYPAFALGNTITFCASFSIFALFAYAPLFLQGGLGLSALQVGYSMLSLSLGWSIGAFFIGRVMQQSGRKKVTLAGALLLLSGSAMTLSFSGSTTITICFLVFQVVGMGMGFISLATLLIVQESVENEHLGIATSFHQFSRTIGGAIGVGVCGGFVTNQLMSKLEAAGANLPDELLSRLQQSMENLLRPEFQAMIPEQVVIPLQNAVIESVSSTFIIVFAVTIICFVLSVLLPGQNDFPETF
ncbi:putative drug resistance permease (EmrB/QacA-family protein) [Desulfamplus magnetovallimortis]|uniref:Putative drug resistance permease (EmrB/QacA-family protein) n=1 Tax=Desulfamplus magnetovallimortis TaxID=1246637 RepID=A0A1W1H651_9BACT|nr:MFS transporter [Desulfamplus magnetovallimortis]SLM27865.1 putative drug resistance permease (EmrB/QacA-family protein) [Desulfamplus magnetovallimortis]